MQGYAPPPRRQHATTPSSFRELILCCVRTETNDNGVNVTGNDMRPDLASYVPNVNQNRMKLWQNPSLRSWLIRPGRNVGAMPFKLWATQLETDSPRWPRIP